MHSIWTSWKKKVVWQRVNPLLSHKMLELSELNAFEDNIFNPVPHNPDF